MKRIAILFLFFAAFAQGTLPDDQLTPQQKEQYHRICQKLIAPCCWRQSVDSHSSPAADQVRTEVARMIQAGKPDRAILDFFITKYGHRILGEPEGMTWVVLTIVPLLVLAGGGTLLGAFLLRPRGTPAVPLPQGTAAMMPDSDWE
jgi:cytochrome c-type biogenesis protein CcmH